MTAEKIMEVADFYREVLKGDPWASDNWPDYPHDQLLDLPEEGVRHCVLMLDQIEDFARAGRLEKACRWLGFVQGFFWSTGRFTLDELKNHNRPID